MSVSKRDFEIKIEEVGENLFFSYHYLKSYEKATEEINARSGEHSLLFKFSCKALYEAGVLRLTRAYDEGSLGLLKIINIFQSSYKNFDLLDNTLNLNLIEKDREFVMFRSNPLVAGLKQLRDKVISHTDNSLYPKKTVNTLKIRSDDLIYKDNKITTKEIDVLSVEEQAKYLKQVKLSTSLSLKTSENEILDEPIPSFNELCMLAAEGIKICNRYGEKLGIITLIELESQN